MRTDACPLREDTSMSLPKQTPPPGVKHYHRHHVGSGRSQLEMRQVQRELIVSDTSGIREVARQISIWRVEHRTLSVRFPSLDDEANAALRVRMSVYFGACGCHHGRVAGFVTLGTYSLLVFSGVISIHAL